MKERNGKKNGCYNIIRTQRTSPPPPPLSTTNLQDGSAADDTFSAVAAGVDGTSVVFAGSTFGSWVETAAGEDQTDFAGMAMDADMNVLWTYQVSKCDRAGC